MILSDREIRAGLVEGTLVIDPLGPNAIQPASVDLRLGSSLMWYTQDEDRVIMPNRLLPPDLSCSMRKEPNGFFDLRPGLFVLGHTLEHIEIPRDIVARVEGKSSLGRIGLLIHSTAGYVDPGWRGQLTLELTNVNRQSIRLLPGMKIGQLSFVRLTSEAEFPYGHSDLRSRYQDSRGVVASRNDYEYAG